MIEYIPILILFIFAFCISAGMIIASALFGPRRKNPAKSMPYECGVVPTGNARSRFSVKYYLVAMLFIIFDIEVAFLYPWAVVFMDLKIFGLIEMGIFILILLIGYIYAWKKGALDWE